MEHNLWVHVALKSQWDNYFCIRGNFPISKLLKGNVYRIGVFNENYKNNGGQNGSNPSRAVADVSTDNVFFLHCLCC